MLHLKRLDGYSAELSQRDVTILRIGRNRINSRVRSKRLAQRPELEIPDQESHDDAHLEVSQPPAETAPGAHAKGQEGPGLRVELLQAPAVVRPEPPLRLEQVAVAGVPAAAKVLLAAGLGPARAVDGHGGQREARAVAGHEDGRALGDAAAQQLRVARRLADHERQRRHVPQGLLEHGI